MFSETYEVLLQEVAAVLDIFDQTDPATSSTDTKRHLVQAINRFREDLSRARDVANNLHGGELSIDDQEDIIETLEKLKNQKKETLGIFASEMHKRPAPAVDDVNMEIDSTASTPTH